MIRFAVHKDIPEIMEFIDKTWKKNHILARDRSFLEYMYVMNQKVNFVISKGTDDSVNGILGFIPYDEKSRQISLSMWKALKSSTGIIGMSMLEFLENEISPDVIATSGINFYTTASIYKYFKYNVGKMVHYYRPSKRKFYLIADIKSNITYDKEIGTNETKEIKEIFSMKEYREANICFGKNSLNKENWYIEKRYFNHPVYTYKFFLIRQDSGEALLIIAREQTMADARCLQVVDMIGNIDMLPFFTPYMDELMYSNDYEYTDCYVAGVKNELFRLAGWLDVDETQDIVPNYFNPFERANVDIYYSCKPNDIIMFRGDGDQDRPN